MAKKPALIKARVLSHVPQHEANNGDLLLAPESVIKGLEQAGLVDSHPDAVAHAEAHDARVVPVGAEPAADAQAEPDAAA